MTHHRPPRELVLGDRWRAEAARLRRMAAPLSPAAPAPPLPPPLPPGRVVTVPGRGEMFLRDSGGPGPAVVLLHGWTASADLNWFPVYEAVAGAGRMIAVDHRGHGRGIRTSWPFSLEDTADDVAALIDHLELGPAVVVGYSMGGPIAVLLWHRHPAAVRGLVLEATAMEWRATWRERVVWRTMAVVEWVMRLGANEGLVERFLREAVVEQPGLEPYLEWIRGELRRADPKAVAQAGRALGNYDARGFAPSIDVPTRVVITTRDRLVRPKKQRALAAAIPTARRLELAADHDAPLARPDALAQITATAVRQVLAEPPVGGGPQAPKRRASSAA